MDIILLERIERLGGLGEIVRLRGDTCQATHGLRAHLLVGIGPANFAEHSRGINAGDRGTPDARFRVFARERIQRIGFVGTEVIDRCRAHRRVGVLPSRVRTKLFENAHT